MLIHYLFLRLFLFFFLHKEVLYLVEYVLSQVYDERAEPDLELVQIRPFGLGVARHHLKVFNYLQKRGHLLVLRLVWADNPLKLRGLPLHQIQQVDVSNLDLAFARIVLVEQLRRAQTCYADLQKSVLLAIDELPIAGLQELLHGCRCALFAQLEIPHFIF